MHSVLFLVLNEVSQLTFTTTAWDRHRFTDSKLKQKEIK